MFTEINLKKHKIRNKINFRKCYCPRGLEIETVNILVYIFLIFCTFFFFGLHMAYFFKCNWSHSEFTFECFKFILGFVSTF